MARLILPRPTFVCEAHNVAMVPLPGEPFSAQRRRQKFIPPLRTCPVCHETAIARLRAELARNNFTIGRRRSPPPWPTTAPNPCRPSLFDGLKGGAQ
jgi:hypothetical protein